MISDKYILDEMGKPVVEPDLIKWATWFENAANRQVANDKLTINGEQVRVSTVFLGLDHNFGEVGGPLLWETMVFGGKLSDEMDRCSGTREQAEAMHAKMLEKVKAT